MEWITWDGGECPVSHDTIVYVRFGDSTAESYDSVKAAGNFYWGHDGYSGDITAYAVAEIEWITWDGGECPVNPGSVVLARLKNDRVLNNQAGGLRWEWDNRYGDITAYFVIKECTDPVTRPGEKADIAMPELLRECAIYGYSTWRTAPALIEISIPTVTIVYDGEEFVYEDFTCEIKFNFYGCEITVRHDKDDHPHCSSGIMCLGSNYDYLVGFIDNHQYPEFAGMLAVALRTYSSGGAYRSPGNSFTCASCEERIPEDETYSCESCGEFLCDSCVYHCQHRNCYDYLCDNHAKRCEICEEHFCQRHMGPRDVCDDCWETHGVCKGCGTVYNMDDLWLCESCEESYCESCFNSTDNTCYECTKEQEQHEEHGKGKPEDFGYTQNELFDIPF